MLTCSEVFVKLNNGSGWRGWPGPCHRLPWTGLLSNSRWSHSFCARNKMKVQFQCHSLRLVLPLLLSVSIQRRNQTSETVKARKRRLCNRWASSSTKLQPLLMSSASDLYLTLNCAGRAWCRLFLSKRSHTGQWICSHQMHPCLLQLPPLWNLTLEQTLSSFVRSSCCWKYCQDGAMAN